MDFQNTWQAVFQPRLANTFFDVHAQRPFDQPLAVYSRTNAWWLAEISRLIYREEADEIGMRASGKTRNEILVEVGLEEIRFFNRGGTQCALVQPVNPVSGAFVVLVFRGTDDQQAWVDFNFDKLPERWPQGGKVHQGFKEALDAVWPEVEPAIPSGTAIYTGHSLGGALATLATSRKPPTVTYTFGSPLVGDDDFAVTIASPFHRVVNNRDIVTTIPPLTGYRHLGELYYIASDGRILVNPPDQTVALDRLKNDPSFDLKRNLREGGGILLPQELADHAPVNYVAHLERQI